jgi:hypothetical protein
VVELSRGPDVYPESQPNFRNSSAFSLVEGLGLEQWDTTNAWQLSLYA